MMMMEGHMVHSIVLGQNPQTEDQWWDIKAISLHK